MRVNAAAFLVVFALILALTVDAQDQARQRDYGTVPVNSTEAIPVGPFLFSPAVQLTWEYRDNIRFAPEPYEIDDQVLLARARLMFELPVWENYVRFTYTPQYREYVDYDYPEPWGHYVDLSVAREFASGLKLNLGYKFISSAMETREVDPGGELMWGELRYHKHFFDIGADYWTTERDGISLEFNFNDLEYEETQRPDRDFYDYSTSYWGIGWLHQLSDTAVFDLKYRRTEYDARNQPTYRDSTSDEITFGLKGLLNPVLASELRVGYRWSEYDVQEGDPPIDDYESWIANGSLSYHMGHGSTLRLDLLRSNYASNFSQNAYYTATGGSLTYTFKRQSFSAQARARLQENDYEIRDWLAPFEKRSDDILTFGLGLQFRLTEMLSIDGSYLYEERDTIYRFSYDTNILVLSVIFGY